MQKEDAFVMCPYYKDDGHQVIRCEGVEDCTAIHLAFATKTDHKEYKKRFCRSWCWKKCLIANMLERKWGIDEK